MRPLHLFSTALCLAISIPSVAAAAPKDKGDARTLAAEGRKALKEKRWADALAALKKADRMEPSPALEVDVAHAQIGAGKLVEAQKTLAAVAGGTDKRAREAAKKLLASLDGKVPTVRVKVKGAPSDKVTVQVDGIEVEGTEIAVNPGTHTVRATADGFTTAEQEITLDEGGRGDVTLKISSKHGAGEDGDKDKDKDSDKKPGGSRVPGAVLTALGGAGLVAGGIFGGLAFGAANSAKAQCTGNACPASAAGDISTSKTYGNVSTGAFIAGGAVALTGVILLIVPPGGGSKPDDSGKSARLTPWIGPGTAGLGAVGRF
jgi:hypothetical protein